MDERRPYQHSVPRYTRDDRKYRNDRNWPESNNRNHAQQHQGRQPGDSFVKGGDFRRQSFHSQEHDHSRKPEAFMQRPGVNFSHKPPTQMPIPSGNMPLIPNVNVPPPFPSSTITDMNRPSTDISNNPVFTPTAYNFLTPRQAYPNSNYVDGNVTSNQPHQPNLHHQSQQFHQQFPQQPHQQFPQQPHHFPQQLQGFPQQHNTRNPTGVFTHNQINQQQLNHGFPTLNNGTQNFNSMQNRMQTHPLSGKPPQHYTRNTIQLSSEVDNNKEKESAERARKRKEKHGSVTINEGQRDMRNLIVSMATLKHQVSKLENILNDGLDSNWKAEIDKTDCLKEKLIQLQSNFNQSEDVKKLEKRIAKRRKKRKRLKSKKQKLFEERQEVMVQRDIKEAKIDKWREEVTQEMFDIKQKAEMKKMADKTLNSVRSKISETSRKLDLLKGLQRLRKIRLEAAIRIGRYTPDESEESFENQISKAYSILTNQREVYEGEEKTLKVLLEAEQEENEGIAKQKKKQIEEHRERIQIRKRNEMLFGKKVSFDASDPLQIFYQYYNQANDNFASFLQVRHSWDCYIVDSCITSSSRIPDDWVLPPLPSNDSWLKYLQT